MVALIGSNGFLSTLKYTFYSKWGAPKLFPAKLFKKNQGCVILLFRLSGIKYLWKYRIHISISIQFEDIFNFNNSLYIQQNKIILWLPKFEWIVVIYYYPLTTEKVERSLVYHAKNYDSMLSLIASWIIYTSMQKGKHYLYSTRTFKKHCCKRNVLFLHNEH